MKIVDPSNPIPKYLQISAWLRDLIQNGRYRPGDRLPSEIELSKMCAVNRNTLRQAISELHADGLLRKEKGSGTFVSSSEPLSLKHKLKQITSFSDDLRESGMQGKTLIINQSIMPAKDRVARALMLGANTDVVSVNRLRIGGSLPLIFEESYLPADMFKRMLDMDLTGSMYNIMTEEFNMVLARCEQTIRAVNLKGKIAKLLNVAPNSAGLFMESVTFIENSIPIEILNSYYRGDKYIFEVELGRYHLKNE